MQLLNSTLSQHNPKTKFIMEVCTFSYLNILLIKIEYRIVRDIYKTKPEDNQSIVLHNTPACLHYKVYAFTYLTRKALTVCTPKYLNKKINKTYNIAGYNGYKERTKIDYLCV